MLGLLGWILCGWIAGSVAQYLVASESPSPGWQTIGLGIAGSVVGGLVSAILTGSSYSPGGLVMSVLGAVGCIVVYRYYAAREI